MINKSVANISRSLCSGCMMCGDICSKHAISFPLSEGFWYPKVDEEKCVNCGLCTKKCPVINVSQLKGNAPLRCYGAKTKDEKVRFDSTSGGFFTELALEWLADEGFCCGAVYDDNNNVVHYIGNTLDDIKRLRQSKYVQSNISGQFSKVKKLLLNGNKVLFCGTPCQVEALNHYLGKEYENLLTLDFICLGICSPLVFSKYKSMLEKKYKSKISKVWFKNKTEGWRSIGIKVVFENGKEYFRTGDRDLFMISFVGDCISMRENCQNCKFRRIPHNSDITVGDFWGIENVNSQMDDNKGISAILLNSPKGICWFDKIKDRLDYFETNIQSIVSGNFSILKPKPAGKHRKDFLCSLDKMSLEQSMRRYSSYSGINMLKIELNQLKYVIKQYLKK